MLAPFYSSHKERETHLVRTELSYAQSLIQYQHLCADGIPDHRHGVSQSKILDLFHSGNPEIYL